MISFVVETTYTDFGMTVLTLGITGMKPSLTLDHGLTLDIIHRFLSFIKFTNPVLLNTMLIFATVNQFDVIVQSI